MRTIGLVLHTGLIRHTSKIRRSLVVRSSFFAFSLLLACSFGCGPTSSSDGAPASTSSDLPEITDDLIHQLINDTRVREVPEEDGATEAISWGFDEEEPKEIVVVEKQIEGTRATIILDIKTTSAPRARDPRQLAGQIRTEWQLKTGWALREWEIVKAENISMKYKNLPKPPANNSNR